MPGFLKKLFSPPTVEILEKMLDFEALESIVRHGETADQRLAAVEAIAELIHRFRAALDKVTEEEASALIVRRIALGKRAMETTTIGTNSKHLARAMLAVFSATEDADPRIRKCSLMALAAVIAGQTEAGMVVTNIDRTIVALNLAKGLKDPDPTVRHTAAMAFGEYLGSAEFHRDSIKDAVSHLLDNYENADSQLRAAMIQALRAAQKHILAEAAREDAPIDDPWRRAAKILDLPSASRAESASPSLSESPPPRPSLPDQVEALLTMYMNNPDGFAPGFGDAKALARIREIGDMLDRDGGMSRMLEAHAEFSRRSRVEGAPRNLEHAWDGIGEWRG